MSDIFFDYDYSLWSAIIRAIREDRQHYRSDMKALFGDDVAPLKMRLDDEDLRYQPDIYADIRFNGLLAYFSGEDYPQLDAVTRAKLVRVKKRQIEMTEPGMPKLPIETP